MKIIRPKNVFLLFAERLLLPAGPFTMRWSDHKFPLVMVEICCVVSEFYEWAYFYTQTEKGPTLNRKGKYGPSLRWEIKTKRKYIHFVLYNPLMVPILFNKNLLHQSHRIAFHRRVGINCGSFFNEILNSTCISFPLPLSSTLTHLVSFLHYTSIHIGRYLNLF